MPATLTALMRRHFEEHVLERRLDDTDAADVDAGGLQPRGDVGRRGGAGPEDGMHRCAEDAGLLHVGHCVQRAHGRHRLRRLHFDDRPVTKHRLELAHGAQRRQPARLNDGDPVAMLGFVEIVRGDQDGNAGTRQLVDEAPEAPSRQWIHAAGGFVEEYDRGFVENGAAKGQPLPPSG
jgi:hypothetical protein